MSEHQHEDPVAHASTKITSYISVAAMAAEAIAQVAALRARERAAADEQAARALRAERHAAYGQARLGWAQVLDPRLRERTGVVDAGTVWARAQAWRPDPEAERATNLAEQRLRELRPQVMERYDRLRAEGADPVEAMRRVAPLFDQPPARTGQAAPDRSALAEADTARRAADDGLVLYRGEGAGVDDPHAAGVDVGTETGAQVAPHAGEDVKAAGGLRGTATRSTPARTPAVIAAEGYPRPINAGSIDAAKAAAAARRPGSATAAQQRTAAQLPKPAHAGWRR
jgi:hypothetical protein